MTETDVFKILNSRSGGDFVPIRQVVLNALEKIEKASDYHKSYNDPSAISLLGRKYFGDNYREVLYSYSYSHTTSYKQRDCSWCKNEAYDNYSLRMGGYVSDYYCAYCFFEENGIEVPEDFVVENIDKENKGYEVE